LAIGGAETAGAEVQEASQFAAMQRVVHVRPRPSRPWILPEKTP